MKKFALFASIMLIWVSSAFAAAWTGSASEPENMKKIDGKSFYVITNADELAWFAAQVNSGKTSINAVLANDIVFGVDGNAVGTVSWTPIGADSSSVFDGIFDGANHSIKGLYVNGMVFSAFIGVLGQNGVVKNLSVGKAKISVGKRSGEYNYGSIIVAFNNGTIENCVAAGGIFDKYHNIAAGGVVGWNKGSVVDCKNTASLDSIQSYYKVRVGGIVGYNEGSVLRCVNEGHIDPYFTKISSSTGEENVYAGGIAGYNSGIINHTKNVGVVSARTYSTVDRVEVGGIVGDNGGSVTVSSNTGTVGSTYSTNNYKINGSSYSYSVQYHYNGGVVGVNKGLVQNCWCKCELSIAYYNQVGGIARLNMGASAQIKNSYAAFSVNKVTESKYMGISGIIDGAVISNSYFDVDFFEDKSRLSDESVGSLSMSRTNMQKDLFAWILNTSNGTEENSGVWTRGADGYPTFANEDSLAIYKVVFDDDGSTSNRYSNYKGKVAFPEDPEPASGYIFSGWYNASDVKVNAENIFTNDQIINAVYIDATNTYYTINFYNDEAKKELLSTKSVQHGSQVVYDGVTPTREATAQYSYNFVGWNIEPTNATEDFDYVAVYESTINSYTVAFQDYDEKELQSSTYEYGAVPSYLKTLTRESTAEWNYTHVGWEPAIAEVIGTATYTAVYDSSKVKYTVTFMNGNEVVDVQEIPYGSAATAPESPSRDGYKFVGWTPSFTKVSENLTIKALFEQIVNHSIVVKDINGDVIDDVEVKDDEFTLPASPKVDGYVFKGWYDADGNKLGDVGDKILVSDNISIIAKYDVIAYVIYFMNGSEILQDTKFDYGSMPEYSGAEPTKKSTAANSYKFAGWDPEIVTVAGEATYKATFAATPILYEVTFVSAETEVKSVKYNEEIELLEPKIKSGYSFAGWYDEEGEYYGVAGETMYVTTNMTIVAHWKKIAIEPSSSSIEPENSSSSEISGSSSSVIPPSSSSVSSSSTTIQVSSSSSNTTNGIVASAQIPMFRVIVTGRNLQITETRIGSVFAVMDMQGRVLNVGRVSDANFAIEMPRSGSYLVRVGYQTVRVNVK